MPCLVAVAGRPALFWKKKEEEWIWGREDVGGGTGRRGGGETEVRM